MASSKTLEGRTAVVTGASRGIGRAIATLFAAEGADVTLVSRSADALGDVFAEITRRGGRALVVAADVTADDAPAQIVDRTLAEFGGLDILVNNAGGNSFMAPLETMRFSGWQKTMALNLDSTVRLIQAALPPMIAGGRGSIINVSSVTGLRGSPLMSHYGAAKAAVISLSQSLGIELATQGCPRELARARLDRDRPHRLRAHRRDHRGHPHRARADGPMGHRRRDRPGCALPRRRRLVVHDGAVADPRRRAQRQPVTVGAAQFSSGASYCSWSLMASLAISAPWSTAPST